MIKKNVLLLAVVIFQTSFSVEQQLIAARSLLSGSFPRQTRESQGQVSALTLKEACKIYNPNLTINQLLQTVGLYPSNSHHFAVETSDTSTDNSKGELSPIQSAKRTRLSSQFSSTPHHDDLRVALQSCSTFELDKLLAEFTTSKENPSAPQTVTPQQQRKRKESLEDESSKDDTITPEAALAILQKKYTSEVQKKVLNLIKKGFSNTLFIRLPEYSKNKKNICKQCDNEFYSATSLIRHFRNQHEPATDCPFCNDKKKYTFDNLKLHFKYHPTDAKIFQKVINHFTQTNHNLSIATLVRSVLIPSVPKP